MSNVVKEDNLTLLKQYLFLIWLTVSYLWFKIFVFILLFAELAVLNCELGMVGRVVCRLVNSVFI